ncbi:PcfJ domain-containing protein [Oscillibacter valericigenes]|nr:PcfJ domain-containing protein [Oscillibacter valericigenes]
MEEIDYAPLLPKEPTKGLVDWLVNKKKLLNKELLVYKMDTVIDPLTDMRERMVKLTCTACRESVYAEKCEAEARYGANFGFVHPETNERIKTREHCLCPVCGAPVEARHISAVTLNLTCIEVYPMSVHKLGDKLALCGWCVRKWFDKDGGSGITVWPYEAYVFEEKRTVRLTGYLKCMSTIRLFGYWEQRKKYTDIWGISDLVYPWKRSLLRGTVVENSKLDLYWKEKNARPVSYLRVWQKHPNIENLVMQGAGALVAEMIDDDMRNREYCYPQHQGVPELGINWKENRPAQMLGLTKEEFKRCVAEKWDELALIYYRESRDRGVVLDRENLQLIRDFVGIINCQTLLNGKQEPLRVARYLRKQKEKDKRCDFHILNDYWRMAVMRDYDLADQSVRYPAHLIRVHDRVTEELRLEREERERMQRVAYEKKKAEEKKKRKKNFAKRFAQLDHYSWEKGGILIRPAKDEDDLIREGKMLHHCVSSYAQGVADGKTAIFFIRHTKKPEEPWFTLELDEKSMKVLQNRGSHNSARTKAVATFEAEWLEHIREIARQCKKQKKRGEAA